MHSVDAVPHIFLGPSYVSMNFITTDDVDRHLPIKLPRYSNREVSMIVIAVHDADKGYSRISASWHSLGNKMT